MTILKFFTENNARHISFIYIISYMSGFSLLIKTNCKHDFNSVICELGVHILIKIFFLLKHVCLSLIRN